MIVRFMIPLAAAAVLGLLPHPSAAAESEHGPPERPRMKVEMPDGPPAGRTLRVAAGGDLAAALRGARPGDVIALQAGAVFEGPFTLPAKSGTGWITIRSSAPDTSLPPRGSRIDPSWARAMPKLEAATGSVLTAAPGAHHYLFEAVEIRPAKGRFLYNLVDLGTGADSLQEVPHHIVFSRCWIHGDPKSGTRRGIAMNSSHTAVVDSWLSDFKEVGADSQAVAGWGGPGPFALVNNHLEGAGENVMFGGADPLINGLVPSDIEIRRNHFVKPLSWRIGDPSYSGTPWAIKNLLELKNARRVLIEENLLERSWGHAQDGFAILLTVRNQDGTAPWSVVEDVTFTGNVVRHAASGIYVLARDDSGGASGLAKRIAIRNNLFSDIDGARWRGKGVLFQLIGGAPDVVIENNTGFQTGNVIMAEGAPHERFVFRDNLAPHNAYGIAGTGTAPGLATLAAYFPGGRIRGNALPGGSASLYPPGNLFPRSMKAAGVDGEGWLAATSPLKGAGSGGGRVGADPDLLRAALGSASPPSRDPSAAPAARVTPRLPGSPRSREPHSGSNL